MFPDVLPWFKRCPVLKMWIVPLSEVHVKYYDSISNDRSLMMVGVVPLLNSPSFAPVVGLKILIKVPYENKP